ncbi:MAG: hypothetical protein U9R25_04200 [Chloroflexota bacterium]|nr:hypothetical protein [Chloroflexota bacterium]
MAEHIVTQIDIGKYEHVSVIQDGNDIIEIDRLLVEGVVACVGDSADVSFLVPGPSSAWSWYPGFGTLANDQHLYHVKTLSFAIFCASCRQLQ